MDSKRTIDVENAKALAAVLDEFAQFVLPELRKIKDLFVEYTPHDDKHIQNLFALKRQVLGAVVNELSALENFILDAAIWSHDWGMAVSDAEQIEILACKSTGGVCLKEESDLLREFLKNNGLADCDLNILAREEQSAKWVVYLRDTHHLRSGLRIKQWFGPANAEVGEAIAAVAEGHGVDFRELESDHAYPAYDLICGQRVNLRALAIYLRIIDILDVAKNRTPYEVWKMLAPSDKKSAMEWQKHAALRQPGEDPRFPRTLSFIAEPEDAQTLAELHHLRDWVAKELKQGRDLLKRNREGKYLYELEGAEFTFKPKGGLHDEPIRFEFDQQRTLHLLSTELYGRDEYVFIRELLQNAIDATRTRIARREATGDCLGAIQTIKIKAIRRQGGITTVVVQDSGVGIDLYVIKKYLSVAGASYYQSKDFQRLGLKFDPISRFGIGLLSCFGIADFVNIETRTDPALGEREAWGIRIQSAQHYWEVKSLNPTKVVGTTVTVQISEESRVRFLKDIKKARAVMQVTEYLKNIAGMVEFPIEIEEGEKLTAILPPAFDDATTDGWRDRGFDIEKTPLEIPMDIVFEPEDVPLARDALAIETRDLSTLGIEGVSGSLSFLVPQSGWLVTEASSMYLKIADRDGKAFQLIGNQHCRQEPLAMVHYSAKGLAESDRCDLSMRCYSNGILVPLTEKPHIGHDSNWNESPIFGAPWLRLNLKRERVENLGMDRLNFHSQGNKSWEAVVFESWTRKLADECRDELIALSPAVRFRRLVELWNFYWISLEVFAEVFPIDEWPVLIVDGDGRADVVAWKDVMAWESIADAPHMLSRYLSSKIAHWIMYGDLENKLETYSKWKGGPCLIAVRSANIKGIRWPFKMAQIPLRKFSQRQRTSTIRLLTPPRIRIDVPNVEMYPPLWQTVHLLGQEKEPIKGPIDECLRRVGQAPQLADATELQIRTNHVGGNLHFVNPRHFNAPAVFEQYCFLGSDWINVLHPVGNFLCQVVCLAEHRGFRTPSDVPEKTRLARLIRRLPSLLSPISETSNRKHPATLALINDCLSEILNEAVCVQHLVEQPVFDFKLNASDFLPGAFYVTGAESNFMVYTFALNNDTFYPDQVDRIMSESNFPEFGQPLVKESSWPPSTRAKDRKVTSLFRRR